MATVSCATGKKSTEDLHGYALFISIFDPSRSAARDAMLYLKRDVIAISTTALSPGVYPPSVVIDALNNNCRENFRSGYLPAMLAQRSPDLSRFQWRQDDLLALVPSQESIDIAHQRADRERQRDLLSAGKREDPTLPDFCFSMKCELNSWAHLCDGEGRVPEVSEAAGVDLDYVVVNLPAAVCCRSSAHGDREEWTSAGGGRDFAGEVAMRQAFEEESSVASLLYNDEDMWKLVDSLPSSFRAQRYSGAYGLPHSLEKLVNYYFDELLIIYRRDFSSFKDPEVTFSLGAPPEFSRVGGVDHSVVGAITDGRTIYPFPPLIRAAFLLCANDSGRDFVTAYSRVVSSLKGGRGGWRSLTSDDVRMLADRLRSADDSYLNCARGNLVFILGHELGHVIDKEFLGDRIAAEVFADCVAFSLLVGRYDFSLEPVLRYVRRDQSPVSLQRLRAMHSLSSMRADGDSFPRGVAALTSCRSHAKDFAMDLR